MKKIFTRMIFALLAWIIILTGCSPASDETYNMKAENMRLEIAVTGELEKAKERLNSAKGNMEDQILSVAESLSSMYFFLQRASISILSFVIPRLIYSPFCFTT